MKRIAVVLFLVFVFSCESVDQTPKPDPFFDKEKMSDILVDMYLIEGAQSSNRRSFLQTAIRPDSFLYKKYKMDSLIYQKNFHYYADRAEEYVELLELTENKLTAIKENVLEKGRELNAQKRKEDSIKKLEIKDKSRASQLNDSLKNSIPEKSLLEVKPLNDLSKKSSE